MSKKGAKAVVPVAPPAAPRRSGCFNCGEEGHNSRDCTSEKSAAGAAAKASKDSGKDFLAFLDKGAAPPAKGAGEGRGHKQKGAGTTIVGKSEVTVKGIAMKEWQRTPQDLLLEHTKREGRPNPKYAELSKGAAHRDHGPGVRFRVILQDPKRPGTDKDLLFMADQGSADADDAKHTVALLALHSLEGDRQHHMKLPEPYRTLWLALTGAPAAVAALAPTTAEAPAKGAAKWSAATLKSAAGGGGAAPPTAPPAPAAAAAAVAVPAVPAPAPIPAAPGPASPAAPLASPLPPALPVKKVAVVPLDVRLTSKHASAADQRRAAAEREGRERERRNKREARLREALTRQREGGMLVMSSTVRAGVEGVLRTLAASPGGGAGDEELSALLSALTFSDSMLAGVVAELTSMGFSKEQAAVGAREGARAACADAAADATASGAIASGSWDPSTLANDLDEDDVTAAALDWLCLACSEDELPPAFDPRGKTLEIRRIAASFVGPTSTTTDGATRPSLPPPSSHAPLFPPSLPRPSLPDAVTALCVGRPAGIAAALQGGASLALRTLVDTDGVPPHDAALAVIAALYALLPPPASGAAVAPPLVDGEGEGEEAEAEEGAVAALAAALLPAARAALATETDAAFTGAPCAFVEVEVEGGYSKGGEVPCAEEGHALFLRLLVPADSASEPHDCITASAGEIEGSLAIYGLDCSVMARPVPSPFAAALLLPRGSDTAVEKIALALEWEWRTLSVVTAVPVPPEKGSGPLASPTSVAGRAAAAAAAAAPPPTLPLRLSVTYLAVARSRGEGQGGTATVWEAVESLAAGGYGAPTSPTPIAGRVWGEAGDLSESVALPPVLCARLYPNTLPTIAIEGEGLTPAQARNFSLHVAARAWESTHGGGAAGGVLFELQSWLTDGGGTANARTCVAAPPAAVLRRKMVGSSGGAGAAEEEEGGGEEEEGGPSASVSGAAGSKGKPHRAVNTRHGSSTYHGPPRFSAALEAQMRRDDVAMAAAASVRERSGGDSEYGRLKRSRERLPMSGYRSSLLSAVASSQVVLLSGETGCGKTTQVPQFLLEEAIAAGRGGHTRIVCTQPRRIAAIGVSGRVAQERCEPLGTVGGAVGYQIRGEKRAHASTSLLFTTTGVLLRRLGSGGLGHVTHVIVDEVHERGVDTDFLLAVLLRLLPSRPDIRLILMSATMDAASFAAYFEAKMTGPKGARLTVPMLSVPGTVQPITDVYLEDVIEWTRYVPRMANVKAGAATGESRWKGVAEEEGAATPPPALTPVSLSGPSPASAFLTANGLDLRGWKSHGLDYGLISSLLHTLCANGGSGPLEKDRDGSILVFLPGVIEIRRLHREIERAGPVSGMHVLHLHGGLSGSEQSLVFRRAPAGKRKVVLSTNVAETSITIDDCTVVIDSFRVKEAQYDAESKLAKLVETWTSLAASRQRRGRAGRVKAGTAYRLVPRGMLDTLAPHTMPEIQRTPLEGLCLQVKVLRLGPLLPFMRSLLAPPPPAAVKSAIVSLVDLGALKPVRGAVEEGGRGGGGRDEEERAWAAVSASLCPDYELTPLGFHLSALPLAAGLAKALLYGAILGCADPLLTIVSALSDRSPFRPLTPVTDDATRAAIEKGRAACAWGQSDHLALVRAFEGWRGAGGVGRGGQAWADAHGLSHETLRAISDARIEHASALTDLGFLPGPRGGRSSGGGGGEYIEEGGRRGGPAPPSDWGRYGELSPSANACAGDVSIVRAALVAGLYPNVVKVVPPPRRYHETSGGAVASDYKPEELRFYTLLEDGLPGSLASAKPRPGARALTVPGRKLGGAVVGGGARKGAASAALKDEDDSSDSEEDESAKADTTVAPSGGSKGPSRSVMMFKGFAQERVALHPSSALAAIGEFRCPWLVYYEKIATHRVFLRDASAVSPYALVLFGGPVSVAHSNARVSVGEAGWISFHAEPRIGVLAKGLRSALSRLLAAKIRDPSTDMGGDGVVAAIQRLLRGNGN